MVSGRSGVRLHATAIALAAGLACLLQQTAQAGPLVCTTSLEAPILSDDGPVGASMTPVAPVEVSRCAPVATAPEIMEQRAYTWTAPYAAGVSITNQVTDILGIAMGGPNGDRVMGFGFPDQTIIWDGTAIQNTAYGLLELQSNPMPLRTPDLVSAFNTSLGSGGHLAQPGNPEEGGLPRYYLSPPQIQAN